jgi:CDP-glycerol glycerophosphotransferase (TagB/SpsB family)
MVEQEKEIIGTDGKQENNPCFIGRNPIRPIWISHDQKIVDFLMQNGYEAYAYRSLKGMWYALRGGVYLYDNYSKDINFWLSGGAVKVNLWHGTGNKKINYDNRFDKFRHPKNAWERFTYFPRRLSDEKPTDYILATSNRMRPIFASAFQVDESHIIVDGYPRCDVLFDSYDFTVLRTAEEQRVYDYMKEKQEQGYKNILYMPTFRESETKFFECMDLERFNRFLQEHKYLFYTKLHPKSKLASAFSKVSYSNIVNVSADIDSYTILGLADMLTTDYSSVHTDYLLLNRPSVLFTYDLEEYSTDTRDCYFEYDEYMPELRTYTMDAFMQGIEEVFNEDSRVDERLRLRRQMWKYADDKASRRIVKKVRWLLAHGELGKQ